MAGAFISFEGGEGSGKSTQARLLADWLKSRGQEVVLTREPGGTPGAEAVRALLVTGEAARWNAWSEACLVNAARADHIARVIAPALARGATVVCDRFVDSTRAYQGAGKGLADAELLVLHRLACGDLWPDLTIVLRVDPGIGLARAATRGDSERRFESHGDGFHARVTAFFNALPDAEPARCRGFDAAQPIDALAAQIAAAVAP
ncbi:thymidylate kinase [alpha proteobacterium AAP81b]|nr:thymidylate kinase [alpha proteobacterium AAP81b]